jgi:hypothetical protein
LLGDATPLRWRGRKAMAQEEPKTKLPGGSEMRTKALVKTGKKNWGILFAGFVLTVAIVGTILQLTLPNRYGHVVFVLILLLAAYLFFVNQRFRDWFLGKVETYGTTPR